MKKISLLFATALTVSFTACNNPDANDHDGVDTVSVSNDGTTTTTETHESSTIGQDIDTANARAKAAATEARQDMKEGAAEARQDMRNTATTVREDVKEGARDVRDGVKEAASDVKDATKKGARKVDAKAREINEDLKK